MTLQTFIRGNVQLILDEWHALARKDSHDSDASRTAALHGRRSRILLQIADAMDQIECELNADGDSAGSIPVQLDAAAEHGALSHAEGLDLAEVIGEFRKLRSCVLACWRKTRIVAAATSAVDEADLFSEALERALSACVLRYVSSVAASRDMFLAVLAHDLRTPLQTIAMTAVVLGAAELPDATRLQATLRVQRAVKNIDGLITDFVDYTHIRLGVGIPINRSLCDLSVVCDEALDLIRASEPDRRFLPELSRNLWAHADSARIRQALLNILNNAVQHGDPTAPISLRAWDDGDAVGLAVANDGKPIPPQTAKMIFEPLVQVPITTSDPERRLKSSLGLGLFIAREIVEGHGGEITVHSSTEGRTVFTIRLLREKPA